MQSVHTNAEAVTATIAAVTSNCSSTPSPVSAASPSRTHSHSSSLPARLKVACIQMTSGADMQSNIDVCSEQIRLAARAGAKLICTPENTGRMTASTQKKGANTTNQTATCTPSHEVSASSTGASASSSPPSASSSSTPAPNLPPAESSHPALLALQSLAAELQVWLLIGSLAVRVEGDDRRFANRSYLIAPTSTVTRDTQPVMQTNANQLGDRTMTQSAAVAVTSPNWSQPPQPRMPGHLSGSHPSSSIIARYDKIFMFDVPSLNGGETYMESARIRPGNQSVLVDAASSLAAGACIGMSICYDLRFPHLYRLLAQHGATLLTVPSAFTVVTGRAHWHTLLRARAIETGCFVLAPAQCGSHPGDRQTYGHSLIVDPWGNVLADAGTDSPTFIMADIDLEQVTLAHNRIPSLQHDRPFTLIKREILPPDDT